MGGAIRFAMAYISSTGEVIHGKPPPKAPPGAPILFLLVVIGALVLSAPTDESFHAHLKSTTAAAVQQAKATLGETTAPIGDALAAGYGVKFDMSQFFATAMTAATSMLPKMYTRKSYGVAVIYRLGGDDHDEFIKQYSVSEAKKKKSPLPVISSKYLGILGRFYPIGVDIAPWGEQNRDASSTGYGADAASAGYGGGNQRRAQRTKQRPGDASQWTESEGSTAQRSAPGGAMAQDEETMVGNDEDEHGCIGSAGYAWCASKSKCLRSWEEECPDVGNNAGVEDGNGGAVDDGGDEDEQNDKGEEL